MPFVTIKRVSPKERRRLSAYWPLRQQYLKDHPWCEITIARLRVDPRTIDKDGNATIPSMGIQGLECCTVVPRATQIHHRNKCAGRRRTLVQFWTSAADGPHKWVEEHKAEARAMGLLCPINADPEGKLPDGTRCLDTASLIVVRSRGQDDTTSPTVVLDATPMIFTW
jgi:hypothetical protein